MLSSKRKVELGFEGYIYQKKDKIKDGLVWRCKVRSCPARAHSDMESTVFTVMKEHDHSPSDSSVFVRRWVGDLKTKIEKNPGCVEKLYKKECLRFSRAYPQHSGDLPTFR